MFLRWTGSYLEVSHSFEESGKILSALIGFLGWSMGGALIVGVIGLFFIISWIMRPVLNIANVSDAIAAGNLNDRAKEQKRRDEVGVLARSINLMADKLTGQLVSLEEERSSMRGLLATLMDGVIALNNKMQVVFLNSSAERALRLSSKNVLMQHLKDVWPNQQVLAWVEENAPKMLPTSTDVKLPHNPLRLFLLPVGDVPGKEERIMLLFRDMTEVERFEEMRSQFMGHVSHELRTPLTIIKGNAVTLLDEPLIGENPVYKKLLQRMEDETDRLAKLVEELLDYARLKSGQIPLSMTPVLLNTIVLDVVDSFRDHAARYNVNIETELPGAIPPILGDPAKIRQILLNLLDNALKFSPQGSIIRVTVSKQLEGDSSSVLLSVKDSGSGIPPENLPYIFDRFYQAADSNKKSIVSSGEGEQSLAGKSISARGFGLGLAIVKELAELHGGTVSADSTQGKGTTLTVTFPSIGIYR